MRRVISTVLLLGVFRQLITSYIDPNTGGMLFQMLAVLFGLISGVLLFFSSQIRMMFNRLRRQIREKRGVGPEVTGDGSDR